MSREQAINYLRSSGLTDEQINTVVDALNPKGDLISKQDAIDVVEEIETRRLKGELDNLTYAPTIKMLQSLPSANQWTPCSEGLPHKIETYIVCTEKGSIFLARWEGNMFTTKGKVLAWMPKPKPWKGEK